MNPSTLSADLVRRLTILQRNLLIDHIDGPVDVVLANHHLTTVRNSLMKVKLLRGETGHTIRPRATVLTEQGRLAVAMILGEYADALVRAGLLEQENPLLVLQRLKAGRNGETPKTPSDLAVSMETARKFPLPDSVI